MAHLRRPITFLTILSVLVISVASGCAPVETSRLKVVTSTSLLTQIVEQVGGGLVDVVNIVPPSQHPAGFDAKPSDIRRLADADLFLLHGWPGEAFAEGLIASADNPDLNVVSIEVQGNWMITALQLEATDEVAAVLSQ